MGFNSHFGIRTYIQKSYFPFVGKFHVESGNCQYPVFMSFCGNARLETQMSVIPRAIARAPLGLVA